MRSFTIAALTAVIAQAEYQSLDILIDNNPNSEYFQPREWSTCDQESSDSVSIANNNTFFIKDQPYDGNAYALSPLIRGGAIQYTVDLSTVDCGCVAGVYAVSMNNEFCGEGHTGDYNPMCPSIDIMQADNSGPNFNQNAAQIKSAASVKDKMLECVGQFGDPIMKLNHNDSSVKKNFEYRHHWSRLFPIPAA